MPVRDRLTLFLCGDVMTGRGVDQILARPSQPALHEAYVTSALDYVALAERKNGRIPRGVDPAYVWGEALAILDRVRPDARIVNLETAVTTSDAAVPKGINYRMHPANAHVLVRAGIDCCVLSNNHVLDWGEAGLLETLATIEAAGIQVAGAGVDLTRARAPAELSVAGGRRVLVIGLGGADSGIPASWAAGPAQPGVYRIVEYSDADVHEVADVVRATKRPGDLAVASIHWGGNWGYDVGPEHRRFAHALVDHAGIDAVHGHSSHHVKAIEVYRGRPILYGCGDFITDYEGITGYESFRDDLVLIYLPSFDAATMRLDTLQMVPLRIRNFRLNRASDTERAWLRDTLDRECRRFGRGVELRGDLLVLE